LAEVEKGDRWTYTPRQTEILEGLKAEAKKRGLWNFWLTDSERGYGLTTVEYAYLAEEMGKAHLGAETFNCSAPDTGNMEVFERYGTETHKKQWLARYIVMVHTPDENRSKHQQHSQIIVDAKTPGIEILRPMQVYGHDDAPHGHMHIKFSDVRVLHACHWAG